VAVLAGDLLENDIPFLLLNLLLPSQQLLFAFDKPNVLGVPWRGFRLLIFECLLLALDPFILAVERNELLTYDLAQFR